VTESPGIRGRMAGLYDVFVDWPGRLGREMPGLLARLRAHGARRVLDAGCGTGRHVAALLEKGFDAHGADASEEMLAQARALTGDRARFTAWRLGESVPDALAGSFDAVLCLGNTLSLLADPAAGLEGMRRTLRPGGLFLAGLKAVARRRETKDPYLPLLRREHEGCVLHFIRFVEFDTDGGGANGGDEDAARLHMVVVRDPDEALVHDSTPIRAWSPASLEVAAAAAGFQDVRISGSLGDPDVSPQGEDVFVHAEAPA